MQAKVAMMEVGKVLQKAGPYVVLEVVLPGGTLFALLLYLHRTGRLGKFGRLLLWGLNRTGAAIAFALQPAGSLKGGAPRRRRRAADAGGVPLAAAQKRSGRARRPLRRNTGPGE